MESSAAVWLVLFVAVAGANLPFVNERLFVVGPLRAPKSIGWRLIELVVMWGVTLAIGFGLEARAGQIQAQGWEFYAAMGFLFLTLAFPGFVWRYLRRGR
ncbi:MAG: DUF2818 family protein [Burkholderiales bacterium]|nr:DUF2818 family protein [Burkholderiales bacterium]MDE2627147.1 DUF2818 family protein [Burkholderiales bacterium]